MVGFMVTAMRIVTQGRMFYGVFFGAFTDYEWETVVDSLVEDEGIL